MPSLVIYKLYLYVIKVDSRKQAVIVKRDFTYFSSMRCGSERLFLSVMTEIT